MPGAPRAPGANASSERYNELAAELGLDFTRCLGLGCRTLVTFEAKGLAAGADPLVMKSLVQQELFRRGVLWSGFHNLCLAHGDADVDHLLGGLPARRCRCCARRWTRATCAQALLGEPVEPVFRKATGFHTKPRPARRPAGERAAR